MPEDFRDLQGFYGRLRTHQGVSRGVLWNSGRILGRVREVSASRRDFQAFPMCFRWGLKVFRKLHGFLGIFRSVTVCSREFNVISEDSGTI